MSTVLNAISAATTKSLLAKMPSEFATKFDLDEDSVRTFLQEFLTTQLGKAARSGRASGPKGTNGKGRISGYILFSSENRDSVKESNPEFKFTEVGKELGRMWGELSDDEKREWNSRAAAQNEANGIPTPTPSAGKSSRKAAGSSAKKGKSSGKKAASAGGEMTVSRHQASKAWVIQGTNFVVQSPKNKVVTGKLRGNKVVALSATDRKRCEEQGWAVQAAEAKASAGKSRSGSSKSKGKAAAAVEEEPEEDEGSGDDDSE